MLVDNQTLKWRPGSRILQAALTDSATSQPISVPLNCMVGRKLDKLFYDILNENIPKCL